MKLYILFLLVFTESVLADVAPFFRVGTGYKLNERYSTTFEFCRVPAIFDVGIEIRDKFEFGYRHTSNFDCGPPVDNRKEYHSDILFFNIKMGGFK